ncbi:permease, MFS superfamily [Psychroflexus torquis ATCC 700755]|uniref:Permease, MFS superfamily n=1 Tax=Psychroflexus torquis (strain ATCC 700755 / CIP 106069 / ACAM 623) TaxID=313595 RepID=K4IIL8_PSYTT|nr:MFS transporter [Psychroflexus torquis]AFU70407.1 permease, MFS superfamily [Psychroflexus torquis ATCC 700755]
MRDFIFFIKGNFRKLSFGWMLTFLSSFGQTYLISLYVTEISAEFAITEGNFGAIYAICTVAASFIMLTVGHTVDHISVKKVTTFTVLCLAFSSILMGLSYHIAFIFIGLIGLRLTGQGMLSHISMTILSKFYDENRGKAISFSTLGFSSGEIVLPLLLTLFIGWFNWRWAMIGSGILLILYLIRLYFTDLTHFNKQLSKGRPSSLSLIKDFGSIVNDKRFLILMPTSFAISFTVTAVIFYQYVFVDLKGWSPQLYAAFFTGYAVTRLLFSLAGGVWVDKFSAKKMFRFYLIPLTLGLLAFALINSITGALIFLLLMGVTVGMSGTIKSSILAEVYGIEKLGAIRSLFTMFMVVSTALGPLIVGLMIDSGYSIKTIMLSLFGFLVVCVLNAQRIKGIQTSGVTR